MINQAVQVTAAAPIQGSFAAPVDGPAITVVTNSENGNMDVFANGNLVQSLPANAIAGQQTPAIAAKKGFYGVEIEAARSRRLPACHRSAAAQAGADQASKPVVLPDFDFEGGKEAITAPTAADFANKPGNIVLPPMPPGTADEGPGPYGAVSGTLALNGANVTTEARLPSAVR